MLNFLKNFCNREDGAVTVDLVVLIVAVLALAVAVASTLITPADDIRDEIENIGN